MPPFNHTPRERLEEPPKALPKELPKEEKPPTPGRFDFFWRTPVVVVLLCLLLLGILVPFKIIPRSISGLTSVFQKYFSKTVEPVSADKTAITSGGFVTLNLNSTSTSATSNSYTMTYPCRPGISLDYSQSGSDFDRIAIPCETPFTFISKNKQITLRVISEATSTVEQPVSIDIVPDEEFGTSTEKIRLGDISLYVLPAEIASTTSATPHSDFFYTENVATTTPYVPTPTSTSHTLLPPEYIPQSQPQMPVIPTDLHIALLKIGKNVNGVIVETTSFQTYDMVVVQFSIGNRGGTSRSGWIFEAYAPTISPQKHITYSPPQRALTMGSGSMNTLSIGGLIPGNQTITIILDQRGVSGDINRSNNRIDIPITIY